MCGPPAGFGKIADPKRRAYLIAFSETGNTTQAARLAGVGVRTVYEWRKDEVFRAELVVARELAADVLESEAFKRAAFGVRKPAGWYKGKPGGYVREYSDILAIFLLKGFRPDDRAGSVGLVGCESPTIALLRNGKGLFDGGTELL